MAGRRTNQALLIALLGALMSGVAMYAVGSGWSRWPTVLHGGTGVAVVLLTPWKSVVVRRGVRRRGAWRALPSFTLLIAVLVTLATGLLHRLDQRDLGPVLVMQVHVGAAIVAASALLWHVRSRPSQLRAVDLDRRAFLRGGVVAAGSTAATLALPHASARFTRSLERGSFEPTAMPVVQWLDDDIPRIDPDRWRLSVGGRSWDLEELDTIVRNGAGAETVAALDCTGGWYARQCWVGVDLRRLLDLSDLTTQRSVRVESETGYWRRFPFPDQDELLLALRVGDERLSAGHGFPARIVAPGRRGFWWVKWVSRIEVDDAPWWWQPPFPTS